MNLHVFSQVSFLAEAFATQFTIEGLLASVCTDVDVDTILVLEALVADVAEV